MADTGNGQPDNTSSRIVRVPDLSAKELARLAASSFRNVADEFEDWKFLDDKERGASYEVRTMRFEPMIQTAGVCRHFLEQGFDGNVAAFIEWVIEERPTGWFASLPSMPGRLWRNDFDPILRAPCFLGGDLFVTNINDHWSPFWTFVAFRKVP